MIGRAHFSSRTRVLVTGVSTRAAAASAARAGFDVIALDGYADRDQAAGVDARALDGGFSPQAAVMAARNLPCDAVAYLSSFENHPELVVELGAGRQLWGNGPDTLRQVRDPERLAATLRQHGFPTAAVAGVDGEAAGAGCERWLLKPRASGGGHGIQPWTPGTPVPRTHYCQEWLDGSSASMAFVANGADAVVLGVSHQLIGLDALGADGFRYAGSLLDPSLAADTALSAQAARLATTLTRAFGLVGLNGIDLILTSRGPVVVEVNPRWTASMELVERATATSLFALHAGACRDGALPNGWPAATTVHGKGILYARRDLVVGDTDAWLASGGIADIPHGGTAVAAGAPVCTLLATADTVAACRLALETRAALLAEAVA